MTFQAYLTNIEAKTGKSPQDFKDMATKKGSYKDGKLVEGVKAGQIVEWLKADFGLGHGHAIAIYGLFKGMDPKSEKVINKPKK